MNVTIKTNNTPRDLLSGWELTNSERSELDYIANLDESVSRFFRYRGSVYDTHEFFAVTIRDTSDLRETFAGWDGYQSDSYFSGVLVRYVDDFERVVVATYLS